MPTACEFQKKKKGREQGFPGGASGKQPAGNAGVAGYPGSIPGSGRSPGGGHGNPLQYSCLENPTNRGAWQATFHGVAKESDTTEHTDTQRRPSAANN